MINRRGVCSGRLKKRGLRNAHNQIWNPNVKIGPFNTLVYRVKVKVFDTYGVVVVVVLFQIV